VGFVPPIILSLALTVYFTICGLWHQHDVKRKASTDLKMMGEWTEPFAS
jgi:hypothetical protein